MPIHMSVRMPIHMSIHTHVSTCCHSDSTDLRAVAAEFEPIGQHSYGLCSHGTCSTDLRAAAAEFELISLEPKHVTLESLCADMCTDMCIDMCFFMIDTCERKDGERMCVGTQGGSSPACEGSDVSMRML